LLLLLPESAGNLIQCGEQRKRSRAARTGASLLLGCCLWGVSPIAVLKNLDSSLHSPFLNHQLPHRQTAPGPPHLPGCPLPHLDTELNSLVSMVALAGGLKNTLSSGSYRRVSLSNLVTISWSTLVSSYAQRAFWMSRVVIPWRRWRGDPIDGAQDRQRPCE
jgi:hypothetical protein